MRPGNRMTTKKGQSRRLKGWTKNNQRILLLESKNSTSIRSSHLLLYTDRCGTV